MALGASRERVLLQVLREGVTLVGIGAGIGFVLAALGSQALTAVLHVPALDPVSYLTAAALLSGAAALAAGIPARRAATVDPLTALRH
jgi:ABC-type antimicrobial peptide transport system permease subunit